MNWKNPVILAVVLAAMIVGYVVYQPVPPRLPDRRLVETTAVDRMEIEGPDGRIEMVRKFYGTKTVWFVKGDPEIRVDPLRINRMNQGMRQFARMPVRPGSKDWQSGGYGMEGAGRLSVRAYSGERVYAFTFGDAHSIDKGLVHVQIEGHPDVWLTEADGRQPFEGDAASFRDPALAFWKSSMAIGVSARRRGMVGTTQGPKEKIYEYALKMYRGADKRGWYLEKPFEERLVDHAVGSFLTELTKLKADDFIPLTPELESRLEKAPFTLEVELAKRSEPARFVFGKPEEGGAVPVRVDGSKEVALVSPESVARISLDYQPFRDKKAFRFDSSALKKMTVVSKEGLRMVLLAEEKEEDGIAKKKWRMTEPSDVEADPARVEPFIEQILKVQVEASEGMQPDLAVWGLDKPEVRLSLTLDFDGGEETLTYLLGRMDGDRAFMTRDEGDGNHEIFRVSSSIVRRLSNTDLNVRIKEIFMIPRDGIRRIFWSWGARELAGAGGDHYDVRRGEDGKWAYADSAHVARKKAVDGERVDDLLDRVNFIEAKAFLGRGEAYVEKTEMTPDAVHGRLIVEYEEEGKVKQAEILLSDDVRRNRSRGEPAYCARFADSDILFFIDPALIGDLRLDVDERPEMDRGGHRH